MNAWSYHRPHGEEDRAAVLDVIRAAGPEGIRRAEIVSKTRISRTHVSWALRDLLRAGNLVERAGNAVWRAMEAAP